MNGRPLAQYEGLPKSWTHAWDIWTQLLLLLLQYNASIHIKQKNVVNFFSAIFKIYDSFLSYETQN